MKTMPQNPKTIKAIRVPWNDRCLARFNRLFAIDKSSYDGFFKSKRGPGYCLNQPGYRGQCTWMIYTFTDYHPKSR